jgi:hypothetical protein
LKLHLFRFSASRHRFAMAASGLRRAVFIEGTRTPFALSQTTFGDAMGVDLARHALRGLITKTAFNPKDADGLIMGTVIQEGSSGLGGWERLHQACNGRVRATRFRRICGSEVPRAPAFALPPRARAPAYFIF